MVQWQDVLGGQTGSLFLDHSGCLHPRCISMWELGFKKRGRTPGGWQDLEVCVPTPRRPGTDVLCLTGHILLLLGQLFKQAAAQIPASHYKP